MHLIYSLHTGGAEEVIAAYARHFDRTRFKMSVLVVTDGGPLVDRIRSDGVSVYQLKKTKRLDLNTFRRILRLFCSEKIDIVHAHNPGGNNWGVLPALLSPVRLFLRTEHNVYYPGRVTRFYPAINYILNFFNKRIIACSEIVRQSQIEHYKIPHRKIVTIRNGIIADRFKEAPPNDYLQSQFCLPNDAVIAGTIGALIEQKGHAYLIEAAAIVKKNNPKIYFLFVGDGKKRKTLENLAIANGVDDRIIFAGLRQDIPAIMQSIDLFVLPSLWEGLPMVILEAMAAQRAIIATNVGGNSEAIIDNDTGILVKPADSRMLAEKILYLSSDKKQRKQLSSRAQEKFNREFTAQTMVDATQRLYLDLIDVDEGRDRNGRTQPT